MTKKESLLEQIVSTVNAFGKALGVLLGCAISIAVLFGGLYMSVRIIKWIWEMIKWMWER